MKWISHFTPFFHFLSYVCHLHLCKIQPITFPCKPKKNGWFHPIAVRQGMKWNEMQFVNTPNTNHAYKLNDYTNECIKLNSQPKLRVVICAKKKQQLQQKNWPLGRVHLTFVALDSSDEINEFKSNFSFPTTAICCFEIAHYFYDP